MQYFRLVAFLAEAILQEFAGDATWPAGVDPGGLPRCSRHNNALRHGRSLYASTFRVLTVLDVSANFEDGI